MLVFVYGTLMSGMGNNQYLINSSFMGEDTVELLMFDLGSFPGCIHGNGKVKGEVYDVDYETLSDLDILEGCPSLYTRSLIDTVYGPAYVYIINKPFGSFIQSGDWREYFLDKLLKLEKEIFNAISK